MNQHVRILDGRLDAVRAMLTAAEEGDTDAERSLSIVSGVLRGGSTGLSDHEEDMSTELHDIRWIFDVSEEADEEPCHPDYGFPTPFHFSVARLRGGWIGKLWLTREAWVRAYGETHIGKVEGIVSEQLTETAQ